MRKLPVPASGADPDRRLPADMRACLTGLALLFLLLLCPLSARTEGVLRALLVSCDRFAGYASTAPAAAENVKMLAEALQNDTRGYALIRREVDTLAGPGDLEEALRNAFGEADSGDTALIYFSTHGIYPQGAALDQCGLVLSDGERETLLKAPQLKALLDAVPGQKILILDICHSGAFIGKGMNRADLGSGVFCSGDYRVLCSSGGSEESWYWHSEDDDDPGIQHGDSYFASVLASVFSPGISPADENRDGLVTLQEAYRYLRGHYSASTPQVYPLQCGDTALFRSPEGAAALPEVVRSLQMETSVITSRSPVLRFSFLQTESATVYYQLIYRTEGVWDFQNVQMISDWDVAADAGTPGLKERSLTVNGITDESFGYVMLTMITRSSGHPVLQASALICVQPEDGSVSLLCQVSPFFTPSAGEEEAVIIRHDRPCSLSITVLDREGAPVRRLSYREVSRPQSFQGSTFSWDGLDNAGEPCPPGLYQISASVYCGSTVKTVLSPFFRLKAPSEDGGA